MDEAHDADIVHRERGLDDLRMLTGDQWREQDRRDREAEGKPVITINGLANFTRQVTGQIRNINPAIKVLPADGTAQKEVAEIYEGLIRQIEYQADAASIYEAGAESAAACGIGHWRVRADYAGPDTFDQEILIERVYNPFAVLWDPTAKHPTRKDAQFCFVVEEISRDEFADLYPDKQAADATDHHKAIDYIDNWTAADNVVVAEYFWIEHEEQTIGLTRDGQVVANPVAPLDIVKTRKVRVPRVKWAKISGVDILEGPRDIIGPYIPVVSVTGEEWHIGEQTYRSSVIRFAKEAQMLYNFARSSSAELMGMQPRAPYLVTVKQVAGLEREWSEANRANRAFLPYHPDERAPPPMRVPPPVPSAAIQTEIALAGEDMKRTTGIYDASLGAQSNETSGVAIQRRQAESQNSTSVYADNMVKAIIQTGKIICAMIPKVYDTQRVIRILGEDDQEKQVVINAVMQTQDGILPVNDLTTGKYDVRVAVGPTYATKRQESAEGMFEFTRANPQVAPLIADLVAGMQDWPEADRVAERIRKTLPPGVIDQDDMPPEQVQQMQAAQAQAEQQQMQAAQLEQQKQATELAEADAKARKAKADADRAEVEARKAALELAAMTGEIDQLAEQRVMARLTQPPPFMG